MRRQFPQQQSNWAQGVLDGLDANTLQYLRDLGTLHVLEEGDRLPGIRDAIIHIESGLLEVAVTAEDRNLTVGLYGPNDTIVAPLFHSWDTSLYFIESQEQSEVRVIPQSAVLEAASAHPEFGRNLMRQLSWGQWQLMQTVQMLSFYNLPQRVAQVLVNLTTMFGVQTDRGIKLGLRITQEELAEMCGARRETLSTVLQDFRDEEILDIRYARIDIKDFESLKRLAGTEPLPFLTRRVERLRV